MPSKISCDIAIVGGGLAGSLIALALNARRPELDIRLIEASPVIGGDHLWTFFESEVRAGDRWLIAPAIAHMWRGHDVAFPEHRRSLDGGCYAVLAETLDRHVRATLPAKALMTGRRVAALTRSSVVLAGGDRVRALGVIDARGAADASALDLRWRTWLGRELVLADAHRSERPMAIDARVAQTDGYRCVHALPLGEERIFVAESHCGSSPDLDAPRMRARIDAHVQGQAWRIDHVAREISGALPLCLGGDFERYWDAAGTQVPKAGMRAALFHPMTGHALPDAVRTAILIAGLADLDGEALHDRLFEHARACWRERGFYRMLNALLFRGVEPHERHKLFEHVYRLDSATISRFYAARSTGLDKLRILRGRPSVPIRRAIAAIREKRA